MKSSSIVSLLGKIIDVKVFYASISVYLPHNKDLALRSFLPFYTHSVIGRKNPFNFFSAG